jgi:hypothetical protein
VDPGALDDAGKAFRERVLQQLWNRKRGGESLLSLFLCWSACPLQDDGISYFYYGTLLASFLLGEIQFVVPQLTQRKGERKKACECGSLRARVSNVCDVKPHDGAKTKFDSGMLHDSGGIFR